MLASLGNWLLGLDAWVLAGLFLIPFIGTLLLVPWLVIRIPADYFHEDVRHPLMFAQSHPLLRILLLFAKNVLGLLIVLVGFAMLVLPGQGLLTILIGLLMLDFPGKYHCERWLVCRRPVLRSINWLRRKSHRAELQLHN